MTEPTGAAQPAAPDSSRPRAVPRWIAKAGVLAALVVTVVLALAAAGAFLPVPGLDIIGGLGSSFSPVLVLLSAVLLCVGAILVRRRRTRTRIAALVLAACALLGHGVVVAAQLDAAADADVPVNVA